MLLKDLCKHLLKKNKCCKNTESYNYSDDQILVLSLLPYNNNIHTLNYKDIEYLSKSDILYNNLEEFIINIDNINKNKTKICKYCNEKFTKISDLRKHIIISCFYKELKKKEDNVNKNNITTQININKLEENNINITNNNNNNNITNNIYLDIKHPIPFDENWNVSKIDFKTKIFILFNKLMYGGLLEELLKNKLNLNVIIDKNSNSGIVYKNENEKYIEMKMKDIVNSTMEKLKDQLLEMNNELKDFVMKEINDYNRQMITKKYIDYTKDKELQEQFIYNILNVYEKNKEDSIEFLKKIGH
jgi:hypothetical protein